jgi:hypothetical protein
VEAKSCCVPLESPVDYRLDGRSVEPEHGLYQDGSLHCRLHRCPLLLRLPRFPPMSLSSVCRSSFRFYVGVFFPGSRRLVRLHPKLASGYVLKACCPDQDSPSKHSMSKRTARAISSQGKSQARKLCRCTALCDVNGCKWMLSVLIPTRLK